MTGDWVFLTCLWVFSVLVMVVGAWPVPEHRAARWLTRFHVVLSKEASTWVCSRLRRARSIRWASLVVGMNLSVLPMYINVIDPSRAGKFSNPLTQSSIFLAPTFGALIAELLVVQRPIGSRSAQLIRRRSRDYVNRLWTGVVIACGVVSLIAASAATHRRVWRWGFVWVGPAVALIALASITLGVRRIVNRPVMSPDGPMRAADEALRADGAHHIAGASIALAGTGAAGALALATPLGWWQLPIGMLYFLSVGCWRGLAVGERWSVATARQVAA